MSGIADRKDIMRGAIASLGGFGGRMLARIALLIGAGHLYGASNVGFLGELAAVVEILAAIAILGLKRTLLDLLNHAAKRKLPIGEPIATALLLSVGFATLLSLGLYIAWQYVFPREMPLLVFFAIPATAFADVALTATRFRRVIRWEVVARCIAEPWGFLAATLIFYALGMTNEGLPMAYSVSLVMAAAAAIWGLCSTFGAREILRWRPRLANLPVVFLGSLPVGLSDIGVMMLRRIDILILGLFVDQRITGFYFMAQQITTVPHRIYRLFEPMVGPVIANLHHNQDIAAMRSKLVSLCRWVFILQLGVTVPLVIFGDHVLGLFGSQFSAATMVLVILLVAELADGSFSLAETPLVFARPGVMPALITVALVVEVTTIFTFAPLWGAEGAALGFLCTTITLAAGRLFLLDRTLEISVPDRQYLAPIAIGAVVGVSLWTARLYIPANVPMLVGFAILAGIATFLLLVSVLAASEEDRHMLKRLRSR